MKIRIKRETGGVCAGGKVFQANRVVDVDRDMGEQLVRDGLADPMDVDCATIAAPENASARRPKARRKGKGK